MLGDVQGPRQRRQLFAQTREIVLVQHVRHALEHVLSVLHVHHASLSFGVSQDEKPEEPRESEVDHHHQRETDDDAEVNIVHTQMDASAATTAMTRSIFTML